MEGYYRNTNSTTYQELITEHIIICVIKLYTLVNVYTSLYQVSGDILIDNLFSHFPSIFSDIMLQKAILLICKSPCVSRKWRQLFDQLHPDGDVTEEANEIEAVHVKDSTCCRLTLCRWKDRTRSASVWTLVDALRAIRCNVVAGILINSTGLAKHLQSP